MAAELPTPLQPGGNMVGTLIFISQSHSLFTLCCGVHQDLSSLFFIIIIIISSFNHMATLTTPHKKLNCKRTLGKIVTSSTLEDAVQHFWLKYT